jgi:hypothetical protein
MSASMYFDGQAVTEVESDGEEMTLWIRSADRRQVVGWTLTETQRAGLIAKLQAPKEIEA